MYPGLPGRPPAARPQIHPSGCGKPRRALSFALGTSCPLCMVVLAFIWNIQWVPVGGQCPPSSEDIFLEGRVGLLVGFFVCVCFSFTLFFTSVPAHSQLRASRSTGCPVSSYLPCLEGHGSCGALTGLWSDLWLDILSLRLLVARISASLSPGLRSLTTRAEMFSKQATQSRERSRACWFKKAQSLGPSPASRLACCYPRLPQA